MNGMQRFSKQLGYYSLVLSFSLFAAPRPGNAAPVTFRFDAVVDGLPWNVEGGFVPPTWPETIQTGSVVSGVFSFDPLDVPSLVERTVIQSPFDFSITIGSWTLVTPSYSISVLDDYRAEFEHPFVDSISLGRSNFLSDPTGSDPIGVQLQLFFYGDASVLDGADIPAEPEPWRQLFFPESLIIYLGDPRVAGTYGFVGTVQSLIAIPEPGALSLACWAGTVIALIKRVLRSTH
jgi:hypothetical protein